MELQQEYVSSSMPTGQVGTRCATVCPRYFFWMIPLDASRSVHAPSHDRTISLAIAGTHCDCDLEMRMIFVVSRKVASTNGMSGTLYVRKRNVHVVVADSLLFSVKFNCPHVAGLSAALGR